MTGSDLRFTDRGERELKGIGRWRVFAVESPAAPDETPFGPAAGPAGPGQMPWRAIAIWGAVAALSFFWGSAVLGIVFRLASDDVQAWWVVLVLGPIPIVVLLAGTARSCGERTRRVRRPYRAAPTPGRRPPGRSGRVPRRRTFRRQPAWLVVSLGGLAAVLALVAGLAVLAARWANRRVRVGQAA